MVEKTDKQRLEEFRALVEHSVKTLGIPAMAATMIKGALRQIKPDNIGSVLSNALEFFERAFEIVEVIKSNDSLKDFFERETAATANTKQLPASV